MSTKPNEPIMRVQGRTGVIDEGDYKGKFAVEIVLSAIGHPELGPPFTFGPFETEKDAKKHMREVCRMISEKLEKDQTGAVTGQYYDMKNKVTRSWEES